MTVDIAYCEEPGGICSRRIKYYKNVPPLPLLRSIGCRKGAYCGELMGISKPDWFMLLVNTQGSLHCKQSRKHHFTTFCQYIESLSCCYRNKSEVDNINEIYSSRLFTLSCTSCNHLVEHISVYCGISNTYTYKDLNTAHNVVSGNFETRV